ncbi:portal protein [Poseidoniales virus YSH_150918]|uniref:Portal protein n=1 Tax=Poseidoniales virus YSH_150918 TaxID=3071324 RepID=A0A976UB04_9CAUD|nr:portal protein [Yangshan Harbor Poseidoniales virus]UVF62578.1 portal protein [Poseidoniales virus YSH_150918]
MVEKRRFSFTNLFRRSTPKPADRNIFNMGIQERQNNYMMTAPIIYSLVQQSVITRTCITQLKQEIFRRGYIWEKSYEAICLDCNKKHQRPVSVCSRCESENLRKPDENQLIFAEKFLEGYVNQSEQLFIDVLRELEDDLNIMDDAYIVLVKEYFIDGNQNIRMHRIKEIYRGDPVTMFIYADENGVKGTKGFTCVNHRTILSTEPHEMCEVCGSNLHPVHYVNRANGEDQHFLEGEVLHFSKYSPSRLYGFSPVITLYNHIMTLVAMENYVNSSYTKSRMPRGLLAVQTRNMDSMRAFWRGVKEKMESDPHFIPVMGIEAENGKGSVEWIKFMDSLKEMDYVSVKDDLRDRISAFYGVSKVFMADNTTSGGLNNEGMQILVTNRAVQMAQNVYNSYVFPFLIKQFGITDWNLKLPPSEEEDEIAVLRKREIEVNIAASIKNLGFEIEMDEDGNFTYEKPKPVEQPQQQGEGEENVENDPYAGTNIDASQLGQMQEQALESKPQENPATTRNKPSMSVGPDKRLTGLPEEAGNQNVDRRSERRIG